MSINTGYCEYHDDFITAFEVYGDYLELFGGEYDSTETLPDVCTDDELIEEIIMFVSFVYDIPERDIEVFLDSIEDCKE